MTNATFSGRMSRFKLLKTFDNITSGTLKQELARRKIPYDLANEYLFQAFVLDRKSQRKSIAFAFPNARDNYEVSIPYPTKGQSFKTSITKNAYTLIEGEQSNAVEIFRNVWDFLTWQTMMKYKANKYDAYILNGSQNVEQVIADIRTRLIRIKSITDFMDNEAKGDEIRNKLADFAEECNLRYGAQNYLYAKYKSLSDYWMNDPQVHFQWL